MWLRYVKQASHICIDSDADGFMPRILSAILVGRGQRRSSLYGDRRMKLTAATQGEKLKTRSTRDEK